MVLEATGLGVWVIVMGVAVALYEKVDIIHPARGASMLIKRNSAYRKQKCRRKKIQADMSNPIFHNFCKDITKYNAWARFLVCLEVSLTNF